MSELNLDAIAGYFFVFLSKLNIFKDYEFAVQKTYNVDRSTLNKIIFSFEKEKYHEIIFENVNYTSEIRIDFKYVIGFENVIYNKILENGKHLEYIKNFIEIFSILHTSDCWQLEAEK